MSEIEAVGSSGSGDLGGSVGGAADTSTANTAQAGAAGSEGTGEGAAAGGEGAKEATPAQRALTAIKNAKTGKFESQGTKQPNPVVTPPAKTGEAIPVVGGEAKTYTPNFKFKANHQEKEFDDFVKPLVKDEESEKKIRKLYEDAHGLEPVKNYAERMKQAYQEEHTKFTTLDKDLRKLSHHIKGDDFDSFFQGIGCDINRVFKWVEKKLKLMENPAMSAEYERMREANNRAFDLSEENTQMKAQHEQIEVQARTYELDMELVKPDVAPIAQAYDARVGRSGAFRDECMNRGYLTWQRTGKDISAAEAVKQMSSLMGNVVPPPPVAAQINPQGVQPGAANPGQNVVPPQRPVIPNISGHATSPVKTAPRSIEDLRKLAKQSAARA